MLSVLSDHVQDMLGHIRGGLHSMIQHEVDAGRTQARFEEVLERGTRRANAAGFMLPEEILARRYALSPHELHVLWWVTAAHLDPDVSEQIAHANDNILRDQCDIALCLRLLCTSQRERSHMLAALSPSGRLMLRGLLRAEPRERFSFNRLFHELIPCSQMAPFLSGFRTVSPTAAPYTRWIQPELNVEQLALPDSFRELIPLLEHFYARTALDRHTSFSERGLAFPSGVAFLAQGSSGSGRTTAVKALAGTLDRYVLLVEGRRLAEAPAVEGRQCLSALFLEAELYGELVCIQNAEVVAHPESPLAATLAAELERRHIPLALCVEDEPTLHPAVDALVLMRRKLNSRHSPQALGRIWSAHLPQRSSAHDTIPFTELAERIHLSPLQIRKAAHLSYLIAPIDLAPSTAVPDEPELDITEPLLERAAKSQLSRTIGTMAVVSEPNLSLSDLILDQETGQRIREIISASKNRRKVLNEWGLGERIRRGTGIVCLFDGDPGTGKTHSAEVIASELGLSLVRINIAGIVDKYIGETEKNLTRIFNQVRADISLLLFDEADSLFSKRTASVSKSTDRYSNMDINVLLQLIERYDGVAVLTTNLKRAIDEAFERRFTYKVHFKMPGVEEREQIWRYLLPETVKTAEPVEYEWLADVELSGGEIKNAILLACYRAAHEGSLLTSDYLYEAAQREAAAAGRVVRVFVDEE